MTETSEYHRPGQDPTGYGDDESDSDLDLGELDPQTSNTLKVSSPSGSRHKKKSLEIRSNIPLRNWRPGRRDYRRTAAGGDGDHDDLEALVNKSAQVPPDSSSTLGYGSEDATLLPIQKRPAAHPNILSRLRSRLSSSGVSPQAPETVDNDEAEEHDATSDRTIQVGLRQDHRYPSNAVSNAKYTPVSFLPRTLYNEFSFFFNLYFLLVALSQIIKPLRIGMLSTYIAPLAFVLAITLGKEAMDDIARRRRDKEANSELYSILRLEDDAILRSSSKRKRILGKRRKPANGNSPTNVVDENALLTDGELIERKKIYKTSKDLKVGDVLVMEKNERFPADVIILKSFSQDAIVKAAEDEDAERQSKQLPAQESDLIDTGEEPAKLDGKLVNKTTSSDPSAGGEAFIRTDQLDGETDWKLRLAAPLAQNLPIDEFTRLRIVAGKPDRKVNDFVGKLELVPSMKQRYDPHPAKGDSDDSDAQEEAGSPRKESSSQPLSIDNTAWANTVLASSSTVLAVVIYTGPQTRAALSTSASRSKTGLLEFEINALTKILCVLTLALSIGLVAVQGFKPYGNMKWYVAVMRFLILFSTIVPISLRVNLDMGKSVYAWFIQRDAGIPETVVRTSTIPEDLGRIEYLLSDKTGTLTQNEMELKKVHIGTVSYANEAMDEVAAYVRQAFAGDKHMFNPSTATSTAPTGGTRTRREIGSRVRDLVLALALCHNVTPTQEEVDGKTVTSYQASSPDEIAIVRWTEQVGLCLLHRDRKTITLQFAKEERTVVKVSILNIFPFTSDSKRMGIIVKFHTTDQSTGDIVFFQKGADTVMTSIVAANDWLDEETGNMAREGLRTLVIGRRPLSQQQYSSFLSDFSSASLSLSNRDASMARAIKQHLEHDLELIGVTGVEDKLQAQIKPSLELLRNAGIKIWMLTGDKIETARCVAISSKLVARGQYIHTISSLKRRDAALEALSVLHSQPSACLLIDGQSLSVYLDHHREAFISLAVKLPTVIACRCSPTQKASLALLIRSYTGKRTACIGDGGNDVSMIQAADVGVGIVGKEGRQASLAADFSITQFAHLTKLLVWHGRNSYKRSAKLAQFVIHRGLIAAVCQTVFSIAARFEPHALYRDWLLVGYATVYTMAPVFSLVLDRDVDEALANLYPELYKELTPGRALSYRSFFAWVAISVYQGLVIQGGAQVLVPSYYAALPDDAVPGKDTTNFKRMVSISYAALVINELVMVAAEITTWHPVMIFSILGTAGVFFGSLPLLGDYFDLSYLIGPGFWWRTLAIAAVSLVPVWGGKCIRRHVRPPNYRKVQGV
ncbi:phospholipid-translocating P-type ATPase [Myriangium duriaei CBS 260.36]|uniref:Phospholipid-transporting ATPase n=1 Tax=Myriangium duriaei CBS 260.36 TaxID=1168546 RepID=A0A9P4JAF5_9PEZI|nr:phospholipid-translocating P-type ATPase [Myriangium duriaei CBS 260.36]